MRKLKILVAMLIVALGLSFMATAPAAASSLFAVSAAGEVSIVPAFEIPVVPAAILLLLQLVSPYVVSFFAAFTWSPNTKKAAAAAVSFLLSAAVLVIALVVGWLPADFTPLGIVTLVVLGLGVQQLAYGMLFKQSADQVMKTVGLNKTE